MDDIKLIAIQTDSENLFYNKLKLFKGGYFSDATYEKNVSDLKEDSIFPLRIGDEMYNGVDQFNVDVDFEHFNNEFYCSSKD